MLKAALLMFCLFSFFLTNLSSASMPVAVKITGCIEGGILMSYETDFDTHKVSRDKPNKINAVDSQLKPLDLSHLEGRRITAAGHLLPGDTFIINKKKIMILGWCHNKNKDTYRGDIPQKRKLSPKEQEALAKQLYEKMAKTDKWDTESFIKLHGRVIEECPDTKKAQESLWRLSNLYLLAYDHPDYPAIIKILETLISKYPDSPLITDAKNRLIVSYKEMGNMQKVAEIYEQKFTENPHLLDNPDAAASILEYADALSKTGDVRKACDYYNKVIRFGDKVENRLADIAKDGISKLCAEKCSVQLIENRKMIGAEKAQELVFTLPEVKTHSNRIRSKGKRPFTKIADLVKEDCRSFYIVYFGEDHGAHTVNIMTFYVDAHTGQIYVYEPLTDARHPLEKWRMMRE